ncbi:MAG TPA: c-type cytochrome domain-containing protein, partial [Humisphaera sp.]|nr:c-type cytochrome domain-containing protein [Humisphaera sp.]
MRAFSAILICSCLLIATGSALAADKPAPTYSQVHAVFAHRCLSCHDAKNAEGELVLESFESLVKGGDEGVVIIPGKANESLMIQQLEHKKKPFMPPPKKAPALPAEEIALLRAWIDAGAKGPLPGEMASVTRSTTRPAAIVPRVAVRRPILSLAYESKMNVAAAARPGAVEIWSVEEQAVVHRLENLAGDVNAVAFSADGTRLFAAGGEPAVTGRIWIWSLPDFKPIATIDGHRDAIYSLAVSADGKKLATGSYDQTITIWDIESRKSEHVLVGHNGAVFGVAFRPDGKVLASVSADRTMKLWDVATGNRLDTRPESQKDLDTVVWSPDGARVAAAGVDNRIRIWKVSPSAIEGTNKIETAKFAHEGTILRIAWSSDGKWILSGADDKTVRVFDTLDFRQKVTYPKQSDWPSALTFAQED